MSGHKLRIEIDDSAISKLIIECPPDREGCQPSTGPCFGCEKYCHECERGIECVLEGRDIMREDALIKASLVVPITVEPDADGYPVVTVVDRPESEERHG